ncbi:MAG: hypothetical protein ACK4GN_10185 [Runella sp.]
MRNTSPTHSDHSLEGLPSFIKSWWQVYAFVIGTLLVEIVFFYLLMYSFA